MPNPYNYKGDLGSGDGHNLFDPIITDHILTREEAAYAAYQGTYTLTADTAAYAKAVEEKEAATQGTITVGDYSFTGYTNSNGHIFYDISEKPIVDSIYEATGKAYYFGIDTTNQRVFLPRVKHVTLGMGNLNGTIRCKGNGLTLGYTNGFQKLGLNVARSSGVLYTQTAFSGLPAGSYRTESSNAQDNYTLGLDLDSLTSGVIVDGQTIEDVLQPAYLYFCVGNTLVNPANTDAEKLTGDIRNLETLVNTKTTPAEAAESIGTPCNSEFTMVGFSATSGQDILDITANGKLAVSFQALRGSTWFQIHILGQPGNDEGIYEHTNVVGTNMIFLQVSKGERYRLLFDPAYIQIRECKLIYAKGN